MINPEREQHQFKTQNIDSEIYHKIKDFAEQIKTSFPSLEVEIDAFSSGAVMLDIHKHNSLFVLAYSPKHGFGVDEVHEHDGFDSGYIFHTKDLDEALARLMKIIKI